MHLGLGTIVKGLMLCLAEAAHVFEAANAEQAAWNRPPGNTLLNGRWRSYPAKATTASNST
jgi:hypothetical protein